MTSQGPHHDDDLVRHLIAAEERLSRDPMQTDVSEVEDLQVTAVQRDHEQAETTQDIDYATIELYSREIRPFLHAEADVAIAAPTRAPETYPTAPHHYGPHQYGPHQYGPHQDGPHQTAPTTREHLQGTPAHLNTPNNHRVVSRSSPRRPLSGDSSSAEDEDEIPVTFAPEVRSILPRHLQDNLSKIEDESQEKAKEKAQRSARVAAGNSFSPFHQQSSRPSIDAFESYQEKGKAQLSYANITNKDASPPSSSGDDKTKLLEGKDRSKDEKDSSSRLHREYLRHAALNSHPVTDEDKALLRERQTQPAQPAKGAAEEERHKFTLKSIREKAGRGLAKLLHPHRAARSSEVPGEDAMVNEQSTSPALSRAAKMEESKKWVKTTFGRQRERSPLRPLRHEDLYPPPKRGPMYSTMPSSGSGDAYARSTMDRQRFDYAQRGLHRGDPVRVARHHDNSVDEDLTPTMGSAMSRVRNREPEARTGGDAKMTARARLENY